MKPITYFPLIRHSFKYAGVILSLSGLGLALLMNPRFELLSYTGLLLMVFSREKNETELTGRIRNEVFKSVFGYILSLAIALYATEWLSEGFVLEMNPFLGIGVPLLLYLLLFYTTVLFRIEVDSSKDLSHQMKDHRRAYIAWLLFIFLIISIRFLGRALLF